MNVAKAYREKGYPADIMVIDFYHWTQMGDMKFDPEQWPDPEAMFKQLKELGFQGMVSVWPYISKKSENYVPISKQNMLLHDPQGESLPVEIFNGDHAALYDPFFQQPTFPF